MSVARVAASVGRCGLGLAVLASGLGLGAASPVGAQTSAADDRSFALSRRTDPDGLSLLRETTSRSPSGFLYPHPSLPPEGLDLGEGWRLRSFAELGWLESWGAGDEAYFEEYGDWIDGPTNALRLETRHAPSGSYVELGAHAIGRDDASLFVDAGRRGWLRLRGYYDELPHRYANDARVLFDGAGGENLTLPAGLVAGGNPDAVIDAALAGRGESRLVLTREKAGLELRFDPLPNMGFRAGYRTEERRGERPFGGAIRFAFQGAGGSVVETLEPLDSRTHDFHGGLYITDERLQIDLGYEGSIFDNRASSLTWENPFPNTGVDRGRFALAPDNQLHRLHGTVSFPLPARGRWTHTLSWASARQNERLLAPTLNPAFPDWIDPTTSLSRRRAGARVDTTLLTSTLQVSPARRLSLRGKLRLHRRDDRTNYVALNPSTNVYGYVVEDGSFNVQQRFGAAPFDTRRLLLEGAATWRVVSRTRLALEYEHERVDREERARDHTRDDRGRLSLSTSRIPRTNLRVAYEIAQRDGSTFRRDRGALFYSAGPPGFAQTGPGNPPRSLSTFEQFDLADRREHRGSLRLAFQLGDSADLSLAGGVTDDDYDARHGLRSARVVDANAELAFRPSPVVDVYVFGSAEWRRRELDTIDAMPPGSDFSPGGPVFPFENAWTARSRTRSIAAGAGASARPLSPLELRLDYQLLVSRERLSYSFAGVGALAPGVTAADAGTRFPGLRNRDHILDASVRLDLSEWLAARVAYRFQHSQVADFHQSGLVPRIGRRLYLGHVDGDFAAHALGGSLQVRF